MRPAPRFAASVGLLGVLLACGPAPEDAEPELGAALVEAEAALSGTTALLATATTLGPGLSCGQLWAFKNEAVVVPYAEVFSARVALRAQQSVLVRGRLATRAGPTHVNIGVGFRLTVTPPSGTKTALLYGGENHRGLCPVAAGESECESPSGGGAVNADMVNYRDWVFTAPADGSYTFSLDARGMSRPASLEYGQTLCPTGSARPLCSGEPCFVNVSTLGASYLRVFAVDPGARTEVDTSGQLALDAPGAHARILETAFEMPAGLHRLDVTVDTKTDTLAPTGGQSVVALRIVAADVSNSTVFMATPWLLDTVSRDKHHSTQSPVAAVSGLSPGQKVRVFAEVRLVSGAPVRVVLGGAGVSTSSAMTLRPSPGP